MNQPTCFKCKCFISRSSICAFCNKDNNASPSAIARLRLFHLTAFLLICVLLLLCWLLSPLARSPLPCHAAVCSDHSAHSYFSIICPHLRTIYSSLSSFLAILGKHYFIGVENRTHRPNWLEDWCPWFRNCNPWTDWSTTRGCWVRHLAAAADRTSSELCTLIAGHAVLEDYFSRLEASVTFTSRLITRPGFVDIELAVDFRMRGAITRADHFRLLVILSEDCLNYLSCCRFTGYLSGFCRGCQVHSGFLIASRRRIR